MLPGLSAPLTLTWLDENEEVKGVSAPLEIWVAQIVLVLPRDVQTAVMDNVVTEVMRLNELMEAEKEELDLPEEIEGLFFPEEEEDESAD